MTRLLAVDPSLRCSGWALFHRGELQRCGIVQTKPGAPLHARVGAAAVMLEAFKPDALIVEWPQVYPGASEVDRNDLIAVAAVAGAVVARVPAATVLLPLPAAWKGQVPKPIHNARVIARLSPAELATFQEAGIPQTYANNAIDAIGLGLWALGRMEVRRHGQNPPPLSEARSCRAASSESAATAAATRIDRRCAPASPGSRARPNVGGA